MSTSVANIVDGILYFKHVPVIKFKQDRTLDDSGKTIEESFDKFIDIATDKELNCYALHEEFTEACTYTHNSYDYNKAVRNLTNWWNKYCYDICPNPDWVSPEYFLVDDCFTKLMIEYKKVFLFYNNRWIEIGDVLNYDVCDKFIDFYNEELYMFSQCAYDYLTKDYNKEQEDEDD